MSDHYHMRRRRYDSSGSDDFEDEKLDPRIQIELEKLNKASEEINRLELELDDARASFRQTLSESTQKLDVLAKKLGSSVEKARPYYDARVKARDAHLETQRAALRFERACSMHEAAKEMVQLAEQGYMRREQPSDPAWQEMLNHATMKVNEAEKERNESELEHQRTTLRFKAAEEQVQFLQKELKRAIAKSKPYFEMKAGFNQIMEEHKRKVGMLEEEVGSAKSLYSSALRSLEAISDDIHRQRLERRQQQMLGVRGAGVGAECPFPPPSWEKSHSIEGSDSVHTGSCQILDPLGVIKIPVVVSYQEPGFRRISLTSGNSGIGKDHMSTIEENQLQSISPTDSSLQSLAPVGSAVKEQNSPGLSSYPGKDNTLNTETYIEGEFVGGDPLGVLPASYAGRGVILHVTSVPARSTGRQGTNITHPAFSSSSRNSYPTSNMTTVTHPIVSHAVTSGAASQTKPPTVIRSVSVGAPQEFLPPSVIFNNPDKARRQSYRNAVDASQKDAEEPQPDEEFLSLPPRHPQPQLEGREEASSVEPVISDTQSSAKLHSSPPHQGTDYGSQLKVHPADWPVSGGVTAPAQEEQADGHHYSSTPEKLAVTQPGTNNSCDTSPAGGSPSSTHRSQKLQGLILRIDPAMDPMRFQAAPQRGVSPVSANKVQDKTVKTTTDAKQPFSPNSSAGNTPQGIMSPDSFVEYKSTLSKSMIRSASLASAVGSEPSEADLSEIDSVSATQSPTKPPRSRLLNVPASMETVEDSSDTESLASTGPMLDDEQVDFLNKDFSEVLNRDLERGDNVTEVRPFAKRNNWSRMSLPPRLSYLEEYLVRSKALAGDNSCPEHGLVGKEIDENGLTMSPTSENSESSSHVVDGTTEDVEDADDKRKDVIDIHL